MIAHDFPPEGNAGVYRPLRFVRNLPKFGWKPIVISLAANSYERYDPQLLASVPRETKIIRVANRDPWRSFQHWRAKRIRGYLEGASLERIRQVNDAQRRPSRASLREMVRQAEAWFYHPDPEMGWIRPAIKATLQACAEKRPEVIWATAGPVSSFVVAQKCSEFTGIPYVLDFRDAWTITYNDFEDRRPTWAKGYEQRRMYRLLERAQSVVFRFPAEAECFSRAYPGAVQASKVYIIPNGYEGAIDEFVPPKTQKCEILYTGTLSDYRYDTLLQGLWSLKQSTPDLVDHLHLRFVGEGTDALGKDAAQLGLSQIISVQSATTYDEVRKLTKQVHALLILGRPAVKRGHELFAGAKLFGYIKSGMPIVGVLPPDETRNVLLRLGVSTVADVERPSEVATIISRLINAWRQEELISLVPDRRICERYSSDWQIQELRRAFDGSPAAEPFVPGAADVPASLRSEIAERAARYIYRAHLSGQRVFTRSRT